VAFAELAAALRFADALARGDDAAPRLVSVVAAPAPARFLFAHGGVDEATHVVLVMVAETASEAFHAVLAEHPGECLAVAGSPLFELAWHHTTWRALKHDRAFTAFEAVVAGPDHVATILGLGARFDRDEVILHVELVRTDEGVGAVMLPMVRFTGKSRLAALMAAFAEAGCAVVDTHATSLEATRRRPVDRALLAFKREIDPFGLLNPGKLAGAAVAPSADVSGR
jgi:FAD/FMN-containing dehydrogenase